MRKVGVEVVGLGALKLTGFLRELMQQNNISFGSLYTVRTLKEVFLSFPVHVYGHWIIILLSLDFNILLLFFLDLISKAYS